MRIATTLASAAVLLLGAGARGADIAVKPGEGTASAAAAKAGPGDVLVLGPGEYVDAVSLGEGVTLRGAGAGETVLRASGPTAINCTGENVTVIGLTVRGGEGVRRGVNSSTPVRVERVRFEKIPEAVALMGAPLSDVVFCDFEGCDIGVRAIAESCPTVWGCRFSGGRTGVFGMGGALYVRDNVFDGLDEGLRLVCGETAAVRHNVFSRCKTGVTLMRSRGLALPPLVRNNVFLDGGSIAAGPPELAAGLSHAVHHGMKGPLLTDAEGAAAGKPDATVSDADPKASLTPAGAVSFADRAALDGKGSPAASDPKGAPADIGPARALTSVGTAAPAGAPSPPVRFGGDVMIANSVMEEYQWLRMRGMAPGSQSLVQDKAGPRDVHTIDGKKIAFDISRFFGER